MNAEPAKLAARDYVQSLARGLAVIQAFDSGNPRLTMSQVANRTGFDRATARRLLLTLAHLGFVGTNGSDFWLLPKVLDLGNHFLTSQQWWQGAQAVLEDITRELGETSSICVLERDEIVYVARVPARRLIDVNLNVGSRLPAYPTALGRVLLSQLGDDELEAVLARLRPEQLTDRTITDKARLRKTIEQARANGYALVNQELAAGLLALAIPLHVPSTPIIAALGISLQAGRTMTPELSERYLSVLSKGAARIVAEVGR